MSLAPIGWRRVVPVMAVSSAAVLGLATPTFATWAFGGGGGGDARAAVMPTGATPSASANGNSVTVSWSAATFASGTPVAGYVVKRYSTMGVLQTTGSGCSGVIASVSCTELAVPSGTWIYTTTPVQSNWTGTASAPSNAVPVAS